MPRPAAELVAAVAEELARPAMPEAAAFAEALAQRPDVAAVLFYGSCLQRGSTEGVLDFYVLTDGPAAYGQRALAVWAMRRLPPNVYPESHGALKAKAAVVDIRDFQDRMTIGRLDTTFWARFCQRAALLWARDDETRAAVAEAVATGVETAALWAAHLAPGAEGRAAWAALFRETYRIEIRVESASRVSDLTAGDPERWERYWRLTAWARQARSVETRTWRARWWAGKLLHVSRLLKAAFTYKGGVRYLLWKILRHRRRSSGA